jgi:hypothetical protein
VYIKKEGLYMKVVKCTESNRSDWEPSFNDGYDDGYFENCIISGIEGAKYKDAYSEGYKQGHSDKYNPE